MSKTEVITLDSLVADREKTVLSREDLSHPNAEYVHVTLILELVSHC